MSAVRINFLSICLFSTAVFDEINLFKLSSDEASSTAVDSLFLQEIKIVNATKAKKA